MGPIWTALGSRAGSRASQSMDMYVQGSLLGERRRLTVDVLDAEYAKKVAYMKALKAGPAHFARERDPTTS